MERKGKFFLIWENVLEFFFFIDFLKMRVIVMIINVYRIVSLLIRILSNGFVIERFF